MKWTWDISQWEWIQHLAVWPLATLVLGIVAGFLWLGATDPVLPEDAREAEGKAQEASSDAGARGPSRHRA